MKAKNPVFFETLLVAVGQLVCVPLMFGCFALAGHFDLKVVWGGILGAVLVILNFFLMAVGVSLAADRAKEKNVRGGKSMIHLSMLLRYVILFGVLVVAAKSEKFNLLALVLPFVFEWPIIAIGEFARKAGERKDEH
ncbi:MAG TPA: ATP synthase subunit I [Candidatus Faecousia faecigallinarum]|nr:ATP synthase subunit I [Candidatus Faecousia faecigallinarum]